MQSKTKLISILFFSVGSVLITFCKNSKNVCIIQKPTKDSIIEVVGRPIIFKEGPGVAGDDTYYYWLENAADWPDSLLNKRVKVRGALYTILWRKIKKSEGEVSRMQGTQRIIKNPTITLLSK